MTAIIQPFGNILATGRLRQGCLLALPLTPMPLVETPSSAKTVDPRRHARCPLPGASHSTDKRMNPYARALRVAFRYPWNVAGCWSTALLVAIFWAGSLVAVWPIVDAIMQGQSIPEWLESDVQAQIVEIEAIQAERLTIAEQLNQASPQVAAGLSQQLTDACQKEVYAQDKLNKIRGIQPFAQRWLPDTAFETLGYVCAFVLIATGIKNVFRVINLLLVSRLGQLVAFELRRDFYRQLLRLDLVDFSDRGRGDLMNRCTTDIGQLSTGVTVLFGQAIREPLKMIGCFCGAAYFSWRLLLLTLIVAPIAVLGIRWLGKSLKRANRRAMEELSGIYDALTETLSSIHLIRSFTRESAERGRFRRSLKDLYDKQMRIAFYDSLASPLTENVGVIMVVLAAMSGGYLVLNQETHLFNVPISDTPLTHGQMTAFFAMLIGMSDPARRLSGIFNWIQRASASAERIYAVLDREPEIVDPLDPQPLPSQWSTLQFDKVSFQYTPDTLVLDDIDFEIKAGETIAVVGPNGCGKSTLLSLPARLYDPSEGAVRIDGIDLRDVRLKDLRSRIGIVSQQALLLNDTVAENIRYGQPNATQTEIEEAARRANAHTFIRERLANGYETEVGLGGGRLSGGQRQRIALARAILRNPDLLILDEATSQVDLESEELIHKALTTFLRDRTTLIITHRPSTLTLADRVVVMDDGRIIDIGTPDELSDRCDLFRRLCCVPLRESA